jgi:hypothetical protein
VDEGGLKMLHMLLQRSFKYEQNLFKLHSLQDLTVLLTEFFHRRKTHILSVISLPTKSLTEMLHRLIFHR